MTLRKKGKQSLRIANNKTKIAGTVSFAKIRQVVRKKKKRKKTQTDAVCFIDKQLRQTTRKCERCKIDSVGVQQSKRIGGSSLRNLLHASSEWCMCLSILRGKGPLGEHHRGWGMPKLHWRKRFLCYWAEGRPIGHIHMYSVHSEHIPLS